MSLILDALKKSETERQQQGAAEFSTVPSSSPQPNPARWLWLLAVLLLINFAVLIGILMRSDLAPPTDNNLETQSTPDVIPEAPPEQTAEPDNFADQVADAMRQKAVADQTPVTTPVPDVDVPTPTPTRQSATTSQLLTLDQLRLSGAVTLPELHLDIHVFSEDPASRFVFINMDKHREGSRVESGPLVKEITPDGVILEYQGQVFLLPRE